MKIWIFGISPSSMSESARGVLLGIHVSGRLGGGLLMQPENNRISGSMPLRQRPMNEYLRYLTINSAKPLGLVVKRIGWVGSGSDFAWKQLYLPGSTVYDLGWFVINDKVSGFYLSNFQSCRDHRTHTSGLSRAMGRWWVYSSVLSVNTIEFCFL